MASGDGASSTAGGPSSFVAGLSLNMQHRDDAASLLQMARPDGYDFCTTALPYFPSSLHATPNYPSPRRDVTNMESKWWSTSIVGEVPGGNDSFVDGGTPSEGHNGGEDMTMGGTEGGGSGGGGNPSSSTTADATLASATGVGGANLGTDPDINVANPAIDKLCSTNFRERKHAELTFHQMISWASHMSIPAIILPTPSMNSASAVSLNYARMLSTLALQCSASNVQLWVRVPFHAQSLAAFDLLYHRCDSPANLGCLLCFGKTNDATVISSMGLLHKFIGCNLRAVSFDTSIFLTNKRGYPTLSKSYQIMFTQLLRRIGRTMRVLVEGGQKHYPPPPPPTVDGVIPVNPNGVTGCLAYLQYLRHLRSRPEVSGILDTEESEMEASYLDHLQSPLQPLADDLEFQTYETFEKDPVKYSNYQAGVELALRDKLATGQLDKLPIVSTAASPTHKVTIMVVGAGRGPLVHASLLAVDAVNRQSSAANGQPTPGPTSGCIIKPHVIAVEKNQSAVLFLRSLLKFGGDLWDESCITIVDKDIRQLTPLTNPALFRNKVDIVVSELLGSFGDNELSPECLQGAESCALLKESFVSIPQSYMSYVAPVSSMRLHAEARAQAYSPSSPTDGPGGQPYGTLRAMETPYVVRTYAAAQTHTEQACFGFEHPTNAGKGGSGPEMVLSSNNTTTNTGKAPAGSLSSATSIKNQIDNDRYARLEFTPDPTCGAGYGCGYGPADSAVAAMAQSPHSGLRDQPCGTTIHGFLGTFNALLYGSSRDGASSSISTAPSTFSQGMFSWFPLYFPFKEPLHVPEGATVVASFWRRTDDHATSSRVWYEWCAEAVNPTGEIIGSTPIHNPNGRSYYVKL